MGDPNAVKIDFKRAGPTDLDSVAALIKHYYAYDHIAYDETKVRQGLWKLLGNDSYGVAFFVEQNGSRIGYFIVTYAFDIEFGGVHAVLTDLFLNEQARRTGAGTRTLSFIESLCRQAGITALLLQVETDNEEARAFYQKSGMITLTRHILVKNLIGRST
jgi:GNAT superfamily N-acetyltransferase